MKELEKWDIQIQTKERGHEWYKLSFHTATALEAETLKETIVHRVNNFERLESELKQCLDLIEQEIEICGDDIFPSKRAMFMRRAESAKRALSAAKQNKELNIF